MRKLPSSLLFLVLLSVLLSLAVSVDPATALASGDGLTVGSLRLRPCLDGAWCGSIARPLDPDRRGSPSIDIGFAWYPANGPAEGTIVAVEGGPGWPSVGSTAEYHALFRPLLSSRNLLLVDNRGTGRSSVIDCPTLQHHDYPAYGRRFGSLVRACGRELNHTWRGPGGGWIHASDLFSTPYATRDMAAVMDALAVGPVDLYGDSYGTWFAQSFLSRYPQKLRSVVLDSAYPVLGGSPWFPASFWTARRAARVVCRRDPACSREASSGEASGDPWDRLTRVVDLVRDEPIEGTVHDPSSGRWVMARVDPRTLVDLAANGGFNPVVDRNLDAAVRAALDEDPVPLLRLAAQAASIDNRPPDLVSWYSDGLYFAASCTDYWQMFDMQAPPWQRRAQLRRSIQQQPPQRYAPFTPAEWAAMDNYSEAFTGCIGWPRPVAAHRSPIVRHAPPLAPADLPVLILGGDLDSWTPAGLAPQVAAQVGLSARFVSLPNSVHTAAEGGTVSFASTACAASIVRRFVAQPWDLADMDTSCANRIPPIHTPGAFPGSLDGVRPAAVTQGTAVPTVRRAATAATQTLGDALMQWYLSTGSTVAGLRGGEATGTGWPVVRFNLDGARWVPGLTVDGVATWDTTRGTVTARLRTSSDGEPVGSFRVRWNESGRWARVQTEGATMRTFAP